MSAQLPPCNVCGGSLLGPNKAESPYYGQQQAGFTCTNCDQQVGVATDGRSWQTILPSLYPVKRPPEMEHEYADHEGGEKVFFSALMVAAGFRTEVAHALYVAEVADAVEHYKAEHPLPTGRLRRLKARFI